MQAIMTVIHYLLPFFAFILMLFGVIKNKLSYVLVAMITAIIAILFQYHIAGGEIFGNYFDYTNAAIYTINIIVVISALLFLLTLEQSRMKKAVRYPAAIIIAIIIAGACIIIMNVWINAFFVKDKAYNTNVIEVGYFEKLPYCENQFVYYKLNAKREVEFLCPNHYFLMAKRGYLDHPPKMLIEQLIKPGQLDNVHKKVKIKVLDKN